MSTTQANNAAATPAAATAASNLDTNTLLLEMHEQLVQLRLAQVAADNKIEALQRSQDQVIREFIGEFQSVQVHMHVTSTRLKKMRSTQKRLMGRLQSRKSRVTARASQSIGSQPSTQALGAQVREESPPSTGPTPAPEPRVDYSDDGSSQSIGSQPSTQSLPSVPRPLKREGAFLGAQVREGSPPSTGPTPTPEPRVDYSDDGSSQSIGSQPSTQSLPSVPRPLKREGAFSGTSREWAAFLSAQIHGGPPPSTGPSPAPEPRADYSDDGSSSDDSDDGHVGRSTFPVSSSRTTNTNSNGNGKKRSREEDIDDAASSSQPHEHADSVPEPAMPSPKRRRAMNGGRAADEPSSSTPQRRSARMDSPLPVTTPPRPDTPRPDTAAAASTSYTSSVVTGAVSSVLSHH